MLLYYTEPLYFSVTIDNITEHNLCYTYNKAHYTTILKYTRAYLLMTTLSSTFTLHNLTLPLLNYTLLHTTALLYETSPHLTIALLHFNPPRTTLPLLYSTSPHKTRPLLYIVLYSALLYCTTPHLTLPLLDRASHHSTLPLLNYTLHNAIPYLPDSTSPYSAVALHHLTKPHRTLHSIALPLLDHAIPCFS